MLSRISSARTINMTFKKHNSTYPAGSLRWNIAVVLKGYPTGMLHSHFPIIIENQNNLGST
ncbi:MAG: hypothetical protein JWQ40_4257 [Segetibacter sp.]|nr:hypothetical protein [Segetibacter sp.]